MAVRPGGVAAGGGTRGVKQAGLYEQHIGFFGVIPFGNLAFRGDDLLQRSTQVHGGRARNGRV